MNWTCSYKYVDRLTTLATNMKFYPKWVKEYFSYDGDR